MSLHTITSVRIRDYSEEGTALDLDSWGIDVVTAGGALWRHRNLFTIEQARILRDRVNAACVINSEYWETKSLLAS